MTHLRDIPQNVIDRIAKLLRLAGRGETNEEKTAQKMADRLMDQWDVEVDLDEPGLLGDDAEPFLSVSFVVPHVHCLPWRWTLIEALSGLYDISIRCTRDLKEDQRRYYLWMEGSPADVKRIRLHYNLLAGEIERLVSTMRPKKSRHVYALGAARYVYDLVERKLMRERRSSPKKAPKASPDISDEPVESEVKLVKALPPDSDDTPTTALARIPRRRVKARVAEEAPRPRNDVELNVELPEHQQHRGARRADASYRLKRWVDRVPDVLNKPIGALRHVPKRVRNTLANVGIQYVGELIALREGELLALPGVGPKSVRSIDRALLLHGGGLHLRPEDPFVADLEEPKP